MEADDLRDAWRSKPDPSRRARVWAGIEQGFEARRARAWWPPVAALGLLGAAAAVVVLLVRGPAERWQTLQTAAHEQVARLEDGSTITVAHTSLVTRCDDTDLCFAIERGSAEFQVEKQRSPLRVRAADVEVRVLGTRFRVVRGAESVEVTVTEGRVEVSRDGVVVRALSAGEAWSSIEVVRAPAAIVADAVVDEDVDDGGARESPGGPRLPDAGSSRARESAANGSAPEGLSADALWSRAVEAKLQDDTELEALSYRQLVRRFPRDPRAGRAGFELARIVMDVQQSPADAVGLLQAAIARGPDASYAEDAWARLARAAAAAGHLQLCREARGTYLARYPRGVHAGAVRDACPD